MLNADDTIVAIASPAAPAARGIVRLSGVDVLPIIGRLGLTEGRQPAATTPTRSPARLSLEPVAPAFGHVDVDLLLWPTRHSYTGQPSAELHLIGSLPILSAVVQCCLLAGARAARPGEFTMRAFLAGRLDLTQAEAVLGVIDAENDQSLASALTQLAGNLSAPLQSARSILLNLIADVEAGLDFADEDIEFITDETLRSRIAEVADAVATIQRQLNRRDESRSQLRVVLRGLPNVGKSCLLNALADDAVAIVSDQAGTTRDVLRTTLHHTEHPIELIDTAGLEKRAGLSAESAVSDLAQNQAETAAAEADVHLWCTDIRDTVGRTVASCIRPPYRPSAIHLGIATKADLADPGPHLIESGKDIREPARDGSTDEWLPVSSRSGAGMEQLKARLEQLASQHDDDQSGGGVLGTAARCRGSLQTAHAALQGAMELSEQQAGQELVASELRWAASAIGEVTGEVYTDDILDRVFSRFCIGK